MPKLKKFLILFQIIIYCIVYLMCTIFHPSFESHIDITVSEFIALYDKYEWFLKAVFLLIGSGYFIAGYKYMKFYYSLTGYPLSKVSSAAQGYVALQGIQVLDKSNPIENPFTNTKCTWFNYKIECLTTDKGWETLEEGKSVQPILLIDSNTTCYVQLENAEIICKNTKVWKDKNLIDTSMLKNNASIEIKSYYKIKSLFLDYRYTEKHMSPNESLFATGIFRTVNYSPQDSENKKIDFEIGETIKSWKKDYQSLLAKFDKNKDGKIDKDEWEEVMKHARSEIEAKYGPSIKSKNLKVESINILSALGLPSDLPNIVTNFKPNVINRGILIKLYSCFGLFVFISIFSFTLNTWYPKYVVSFLK